MKIINPTYKILNVSPKGQDAVEFIEQIARTCYRSEGNTGEKFVKNLIKRGHGAMLEFGWLTVEFTCDRAIANELVRHRLCSFAQESTRYCDYNKAGEIEVICPAELLKFSPASEALFEWNFAVSSAEKAYKTLRAAGVKPQIARSVLPLCTATHIVMAGNFREWRHVFQLRTASAAHPQMRELMCPLLEEVKSIVPVIFEDITKNV